MTRSQTMVQLSDELVELLDQRARRLEMSRSALIRDILARHLAADSEARISERIVAGYHHKPPAVPDAWGDLAAQSQRAATETAQRLDAEEHEAGLAPW